MGIGRDEGRLPGEDPGLDVVLHVVPGMMGQEEIGTDGAEERGDAALGLGVAGEGEVAVPEAGVGGLEESGGRRGLPAADLGDRLRAEGRRSQVAPGHGGHVDVPALAAQEDEGARAGISMSSGWAIRASTVGIVDSFYSSSESLTGRPSAAERSAAKATRWVS